MGILIARNRAGRPQPNAWATQNSVLVCLKSAQTRRYVHSDLSRTATAVDQ